MKTFRELTFKGTKEQLLKFSKEIGLFVKGDWVLQPATERFKDYLQFSYRGTSLENAIVSIYIGDKLQKGEIMVGNIVPQKKNSLTVDEYNALLLRFYEDIIRPYKEQGTEIIIEPPTDDIFDPRTIISEEALRKLKAFCDGANKTTGSSHPMDRERWFDFICQTVDDDRVFEYSALANFLKDEAYWGTKQEGFIGAMGDYAWSEDKAYELADEYSAAVEVLQYYKKTRGI